MASLSVQESESWVVLGMTGTIGTNLRPLNLACVCWALKIFSETFGQWVQERHTVKNSVTPPALDGSLETYQTWIAPIQPSRLQLTSGSTNSTLCIHFQVSWRFKPSTTAHGVHCAQSGERLKPMTAAPIISTLRGSGRGSVGRAVASNTSDLRFKSQHRQILSTNCTFK